MSFLHCSSFSRCYPDSHKCWLVNSPHPVSIRSLILLPWSERKSSREKWELQDWHYLLYDDAHWSLFCCKMCSFLPSVFWKSSACWYHTPSISDTPQGRVCMSLHTCAKHLTKSNWLDVLSFILGNKKIATSCLVLIITNMYYLFSMEISGIWRWGENVFPSIRQTRTSFGWKAGKGSGNAPGRNRLGTTPAWKEFVGGT